MEYMSSIAYTGLIRDSIAYFVRIDQPYLYSGVQSSEYGIGVRSTEYVRSMITSPLPHQKIFR